MVNDEEKPKKAAGAAEQITGKENIDLFQDPRFDLGSPEFDPDYVLSVYNSDLYQKHVLECIAKTDDAEQVNKLYGLGLVIGQLVEVIANDVQNEINNPNWGNDSGCRAIAIALQMLTDGSKAMIQHARDFGIPVSTLDDASVSDASEAIIEKLISTAKAAVKKTPLPAITIAEKGTKKLDYPLDKVNANIWTKLNKPADGGRLALTFAAEKRGSNQEANITYSIDFNELEKAGLSEVKELTAFDKRAYIAAGALFNSAGEYTTISQIYATMGGNGKPSAKDIEKINTSLKKMRKLQISLDNSSEHDVLKDRKKYIYSGALLPSESIDAIVNGQHTDSAIHFFREPPLITFAKERKQITTIPRELLQSPISKTDANLQIDDYLTTRISHIKTRKLSNKMLYKTIYENCGITTKMQRSRAKDKIATLLEHYKDCGFIKDFNETADGIAISY